MLNKRLYVTLAALDIAKYKSNQLSIQVNDALINYNKNFSPTVNAILSDPSVKSQACTIVGLADEFLKPNEVNGRKLIPIDLSACLQNSQDFQNLM